MVFALLRNLLQSVRFHMQFSQFWSDFVLLIFPSRLLPSLFLSFSSILGISNHFPGTALFSSVTSIQVLGGGYTTVDWASWGAMQLPAHGARAVLLLLFWKCRWRWFSICTSSHPVCFIVKLATAQLRVSNILLPANRYGLAVKHLS